MFMTARRWCCDSCFLCHFFVKACWFQMLSDPSWNWSVLIRSIREWHDAFHAHLFFCFLQKIFSPVIFVFHRFICLLMVSSRLVVYYQDKACLLGCTLGAMLCQGSPFLGPLDLQVSWGFMLPKMHHSKNRWAKNLYTIKHIKLI